MSVALAYPIHFESERIFIASRFKLICVRDNSDQKLNELFFLIEFQYFFNTSHTFYQIQYYFKVLKIYFTIKYFFNAFNIVWEPCVLLKIQLKHKNLQSLE